MQHCNRRRLVDARLPTRESIRKVGRVKGCLEKRMQADWMYLMMIR